MIEKLLRERERERDKERERDREICYVDIETLMLEEEDVRYMLLWWFLLWW